jgi:hypothetical protein
MRGDRNGMEKIGEERYRTDRDRSDGNCKDRLGKEMTREEKNGKFI